MIGPSTFRFLSVEHEVASANDWDRPEWPKLWLYNLHYFDDLNAEGASSRSEWHRALIVRWINENPPAVGNGWEPYPVSIRIVNWVKWSLAGNSLEPLWVHSLAIQARWLQGRLEWHLLGNHLFANAKALVFAGIFFTGPEANAWMDRGLAILCEQLPEQVLADGGHFERSPMYHAIACEDLLDLLNLSRCYPSVIPENATQRWREIAGRMLKWLGAMTHPDGEIVQFNDSAFGIAPKPEQLLRYATSIGVSSPPPVGAVTVLGETGYVRVERGPAVVFVDVAPIGPDYLPGHAHADTLTFELTLFGQRWIVDDGCSTYEAGEERHRQRGTAAHNTVVVDDTDSSEVWGSFRVARRARVIGVAVSDNQDRGTVTASHDGYLRLPGRVTHRRTLMLAPTALEIVDNLDGKFRVATANVLLHPQVKIRYLDGQNLDLHRDGHAVKLVVRGGCARVEPAMWHPEFGFAHPTHRLSLTFESSRLTSRLVW
jgi:uncharacterized heparinase superfamily protein